MNDIVNIELEKLGELMIELSKAPEEISEDYILKITGNIMACLEEIVESRGQPNLNALMAIHHKGNMIIAEEAIRSGIFPPDTSPEEALKILEGKA